MSVWDVIYSVYIGARYHNSIKLCQYLYKCYNLVKSIKILVPAFYV